MQKKSVKIFWAQWKKKQLPLNKYSTISDFDGSIFSDNVPSWSVVLEITGDENCTGLAYFLSDKAPSGLIDSGRWFDMYEGSRLSCIVYVL